MNPIPSDAAIARRTPYKVRFDQHDLDYYMLAWAMGPMTYGGAAIGEVLYAASQIDEGAPLGESWVPEWQAASLRAEAWADACAEREQHVSARDAYLRAFTYQRMAMMGERCSSPGYAAECTRLRLLFGSAAVRFTPTIESVSIPFEGLELPAYFIPAVDSAGPRPTVIGLGGGETFVEDLYFGNGAAAGRERGYNVLILDLPGQGTTPQHGARHRPDTERPVGVAIDWVVARQDVDASRIALYGCSLGGYLVTRVAAHDPRVRAAVAAPPTSDFGEIIRGFLPPVLTGDPATAARPVADLFETPDLGLDETSLTVVEKLATAWGARTVAELLELVAPWRVDPSLVTCPYLGVLGGGDAEVFHTQTHTTFDSIRAPKELRVFDATDGADSHSQRNNLRLAFEVVYGWLDETMS